ncbi:hypothetical protein [Riemerella columbina]|uniref:hypothetical protein n=1 Tax=Riemerella columbina TaxID=103810 RepID=UPI0003723102|nr:hypothetical protein [Riemerella columbina]
MKSLTITGVVLAGIAAILFYMTTDFSVERITISHLMGMMAGIGVGLIIGGLVGYVSKGNAVREAAKIKEYERLQREKQEIEKQAASLAAQQARQEAHNNNTAL